MSRSSGGPTDRNPPIPKHLVEAVERLVAVYQQLQGDLGSEPSFKELCEAMFPQSPDAKLSHQDPEKKMEFLLEQLGEFERKILELRFGLEDGRPRTLQEIGESMMLTRERVRDIEARALRKLRPHARGHSVAGSSPATKRPRSAPAEVVDLGEYRRRRQPD